MHEHACRAFAQTHPNTVGHGPEQAMHVWMQAALAIAVACVELFADVKIILAQGRRGARSGRGSGFTPGQGPGRQDSTADSQAGQSAVWGCGRTSSSRLLQRDGRLGATNAGQGADKQIAMRAPAAWHAVLMHPTSWQVLAGGGVAPILGPSHAATACKGGRRADNSESGTPSSSI